MASLGELTAGIAHEIQNPLNFVNNFSEVNKEMMEELRCEQSKPRAERWGIEDAIFERCDCQRRKDHSSRQKSGFHC